MPLDPDSLPDELVPFADALELVSARPDYERGWISLGWSAPPTPLIPGAPPYDGVYRGSWISPGVCLRLDLGAIPERVASALRARHPDRIGADGAFYELGIRERSQRANRTEVLLSLALKLAEIG